MKKQKDFITKHKNKIIIAVIIALFAVIPPTIINIAYLANGPLQTIWDGTNLLLYYGSFLGAAGSIVLGVVAWKQNTRLLTLEENNFIATNACTAIITQISIRGLTTQAINLDTEHQEQVLFSSESESEQIPESISIIINLKNLSCEIPPALVRVKKITLAANKMVDDNSPCYIFAHNNKTEFTRVALSENGSMFECTIMISHNEKNHIKNILSELCTAFFEIDLSLMTDKYVVTDLTCRAKLDSVDYDRKTNLYCVFLSDKNNPPLTFWKGNHCMNKSQVIIKLENNQEDSTNGQT